MIRVLSLICILISACSTNSTETEKWIESNAVDDAKVQFKKFGYTTIVLEDGHGSTYSGERQNNQNIKCKISNLDINIKVFKVEMVTDERLRNYVSKFNKEMQRLKEVRDGCEDANKLL